MKQWTPRKAIDHRRLKRKGESGIRRTRKGTRPNSITGEGKREQALQKQREAHGKEKKEKERKKKEKEQQKKDEKERKAKEQKNQKAKEEEEKGRQLGKARQELSKRTNELKHHR